MSVPAAFAMAVGAGPDHQHAGCLILSCFLVIALPAKLVNR